MNDLIIIPASQNLPATLPATPAAVPAPAPEKDDLDRTIEHYRKLVATGVRVPVPGGSSITALSLFTSGKPEHIKLVPAFIKAQAAEIAVPPKMLAAVVTAALRRRSAADAASLAKAAATTPAYDPVTYHYDEDDGVVKAYDTRTMDRIDGTPWTPGYGLKDY
ncbi:hypothetical protein OIV56_26815 [Burkholderia pseudomallei]|uniref:hypothetical protein n=1 Tax=Burkholderia pseudomallei TaxID=28450 RepID=UPI0021F7778A|nr:hypothetical protein [Burkholderia pseudomallei]MCW0166347.1 hypothetical protein [Burkholderia pseudomallei]